MTYSGAEQAGQAREKLSEALAALQEDPNIPEDVMAVAQNIAQAVAALYEANQASSEPDGKSCVRNALGSLSQTLALLQDVRTQHHGIQVATEVIATVMNSLYPLTTVPSKAPPRSSQTGDQEEPFVPKAPNAPAGSADAAQTSSAQGRYGHSSAAFAPTQEVEAGSSQPAPAQESKAKAPSAPQDAGSRQNVEVNIGATTESNFYVGFSGEISEGGVFLATYEVLPEGTPVHMLVTLPGGFEFQTHGTVQFVRDPMDLSSEAEPGMGIRFEALGQHERELILRFIRKRPPMFYDE